MSRLTPISCTLVPDAPSHLRQKLRPMGHRQTQWLRKKVDVMIDSNLLKHVSDANYACQVCVVNKNGPAIFHMVSDMRHLNETTVRTST